MQEEPIPILYSVDSLGSQLTGVGYYTKYLLNELLSRNDVAVQCFAGNQMVGINYGDSDMETKVPPQRKSFLRRAAGRIVSKVSALSVVRSQLFQLRVGRRIKPGSLYHETNHIMRPVNGLAVVTIHDLSTIHHPQYHPAERLRYFERELPGTLARANHILTVSEFSRQDIIKTLGVPSDKVSVTYNGVHARFRPVPGDIAGPTLAKWGLSYGRYLLSVGTLEPRKNLVTVVNAFERLPQRLRRHWPMVIVGPKGWLYDAYEDRLDKLERKGELVRIGYVPDEVLPVLYSGATAFVFLSIYEGFGMPVIEAAACGTPILTSIGTAMEEIAGSVAQLIDPLDESACTEALHQLLEDSAIRERAQKNGPKLAGRYTWSRTAENTVTVYGQVFSNG